MEGGKKTRVCLCQNDLLENIQSHPTIGFSYFLFVVLSLPHLPSVGPETPDEEFDFQSKLEEFEKEGDENDDDCDDEAGDAPDGHTAYDKDDFFDSISCDAIDR